MKLDPVLLEILVCPDCKGSLTVDDASSELVCDDCGLVYPVRDDIPIMLVSEARRPERAAAEADADSGADDAESTTADDSDAEAAEASDD